MIKEVNIKSVESIKLLHFYIILLQDLGYKLPNSFEELKDIMCKEFNYECSLTNISNYFEQHCIENILDVKQQMKNLGIRYD